MKFFTVREPCIVYFLGMNLYSFTRQMKMKKFLVLGQSHNTRRQFMPTFIDI